jgi:serine protease Do
MQKTTLALIALLAMGTASLAQEKTAPLKKTEKKEIVIEEKAKGKNEKTVIVIDNDKVTINGKPASEYKGKKHIIIDDDIIISGGNARMPLNRNVTVTTSGGNRAYLGVATEKSDKGARVTEVIEKSAAEKAGLKEGDIITNISGTAIKGSDDLSANIRKHKPEETIDITYLRDGKEKKVKALLGKTDEAMLYNFGETFGRDFERNFNFKMEPPVASTLPRYPRGFYFGDDNLFEYRIMDRPKFGMDVEDNPDGDGVKVSKIEIESNAAKAGLMKDDIITEVESNSIKNVDDLREELDESRDKSVLQMKVLRNGKTETLSVRVPKKIKTAEL